MTGGTGFIGSHLVEALLARGHEVRCLVRDTRRLGWISGLGSVTIAHGSMDEPRSLLEGMRGVDQVYHVAWNSPGGWHDGFCQCLPVRRGLSACATFAIW